MEIRPTASANTFRTQDPSRDMLSTADQTAEAVQGNQISSVSFEGKTLEPEKIAKLSADPIVTGIAIKLITAASSLLNKH